MLQQRTVVACSQKIRFGNLVSNTKIKKVHFFAKRWKWKKFIFVRNENFIVFHLRIKKFGIFFNFFYFFSSNCFHLDWFSALNQFFCLLWKNVEDTRSLNFCLTSLVLGNLRTKNISSAWVQWNKIESYLILKDCSWSVIAYRR